MSHGRVRIKRNVIMLRLNCFISVAPDKREQAIEMATQLTEASRKEAGCIAYDIFCSATRPDVLLICETWADEAALDAHKQTEHYRRLAVEGLRSIAQLKGETFRFEK